MSLGKAAIQLCQHIGQNTFIVTGADVDRLLGVIGRVYDVSAESVRSDLMRGASFPVWGGAEHALPTVYTIGPVSDRHVCAQRNGSGS